ncbi:MAG: glucose PTS transporter subunit EIIB [Flaviflexus sp.]|nr:glucose PTS transporter subunit EIIB [Flaviflexus sp.]
MHALFDGLSFAIADLLQIRIGNTFSGGLIDYLLFGVFQGQEKTHWLYVLPVGIIWFCLYYVVFRWYVRRFHVATPGHLSDTEGDGGAEASSDGTPKEEALRDEAEQILAALGGEENIEDVDACITRLRVAVRDSDKVDRETLKRLGAAAVLDVSGGIQAVYGAKAVLYKSAIVDILGIDD